MVFDLLGEDLEPGGLERIFLAARQQFDDEELSAIVLDLGFVQRVLGLLAVRCAASGVEDLFFEQGMERQFRAGLLDDRGLAPVGGGLELREQGLYPAMISLEQVDGVGHRIGWELRGLAGLGGLTGCPLVRGGRRPGFRPGSAGRGLGACNGLPRRRGGCSFGCGRRRFCGWRSGVFFRRLHDGSCRKGTGGKSALWMRVPVMPSRSEPGSRAQVSADLPDSLLPCMRGFAGGIPVWRAQAPQLDVVVGVCATGFSSGLRAPRRLRNYSSVDARRRPYVA